MGVEVEIKLALAGLQDFESACRLGQGLGLRYQDNRFFDVADRALSKKHWALRLRREWKGRHRASGPPDRILLTMKGPGKVLSGALSRAEYEWASSASCLNDLFSGNKALADCAEGPNQPPWTQDPFFERIGGASLADMEQVAFFGNLRVQRRVELAGRPVTLEVDQTSLPSGRRVYEVELEIATGEQQAPDKDLVERLRRELIGKLAENRIVVIGTGRGKFSTALRDMEETMQWNVPKEGCVLRFAPLAKARVWGGHKLSEQYQKPPAPENQPCGETWEIVDLPDDQSRVVAGPLAGATLHDLKTQHLDWLMGQAPLLDGRFPLLLKLIDAARTLSVQVHPDEEAAAKLGARPKTECWVILHADPGAHLYLGLAPGVTKEQLREACKGPSLEELLNEVEVSPLDVVFIPAGTVHAIGGGLVLAELQQSSDTTYRLHDWGRMGLDGKPRQLHIDQALESIHFEMPDPAPWQPRRGPGPVISSDAFDMELMEWTQAAAQPETLEHDGPLVLLALKGQVRVQAGGDDERLGPGQAALVPAASRQTLVTGLEKDTWLLVGRPGPTKAR